MKLIVGLGNPDKKYQNTRHNLGQNIIRQYLKKQNLHLENYPKFKAALVQNRINNKPEILLGQNLNFMNDAGVTIQKISNFYKIPSENILIIHDDLDLPVGEYRVQFDRGPAGHNGIKSIIEKLGTQQFNRIRIGIGKPQGNISVEDYVLKNFSQEESSIISSITPEIFKEIENYISTI